MARTVKQAARPLPVRHAETVDLFGTIDRAFDRMLESWPMMPFRRPVTTARHWLDEVLIPVDEFHKNGALVIRAELPGVDPERDVELTVSGGMLHIGAHRHEEESVESEHYVRKEIHHGAFTRVVPLPEGVTEADIKATYKNGVLEITVPTPEPQPAKKIAIAKG